MSDPFKGDKPDEGLIETVYQHLDQLWAAVRQEMAEIDTFHDGTFGVWKDANDPRPQYHPPSGRYLIDQAVDTQMSVDPTIKKFPGGEGRVHKDKADKAEPALTAVMMDAALMEPVIPWRQAYKYLVQYGRCAIGVQWDMSEKPKEPKRKAGQSDEEWQASQHAYEQQQGGWNPVRIKAPNPARVLMNPLDMQPDFCIITKQQYAQELYDLTKAKSRYGKGKAVQVYEASVDSNPYRAVKTLEVWTRNWHCLKVAGGQMLFLERNPFEFQPYAHAYAGWGGEPTYEMDYNTNYLPKYLAVGMIAGIKELLRVQAQQKSALHNAILETGYARLGTSRPAEEVAQQMASGPNTVLTGQKEEWWFLQYPELSRALFEEQENTDLELERATQVRGLHGERQSGVNTVGQQMILQQNANKKFYVLSKQMERLATITARNILAMVDISGESITLRGMTLSPTLIDGTYDVDVLFKQVDPMIQLDMKRDAREDVKLGLISPETFREQAGMENEQEERARLLDAEIDKMPEVHQEIVAQALIAKGFKDLGEHMLEMLRIQRQQQRDQAAQGMPQALQAGAPPTLPGAGTAPGAVQAAPPMIPTPPAVAGNGQMQTGAIPPGGGP